MRNILSLVFVFVIAGVIHGQSTSNSPYSYYGLGESGGLDHANFGAMGNANLTAFDSTVLNFYNPSTYNTLSNGAPLFSFGISSRLSTFSEGDDQNFSPISTLHHFAMAFPVKKYFGFAFGFKPYSRRGYMITNSVGVNSDSIKYEYEGKGGTHEVFLGLSSDLIHKANTRLSVGMNAGYVFGTTENIRRSYLSGLSAGGVSEKNIRINAFHYEMGAFFTHTFKVKHTLRLATTFEPIQMLKAEYSDILFYSSSDVHNPKTFDTINSRMESAKFTIAPTMKFGAAYLLDIGKGSTQMKRKSQIAFHLNYSMTDWSKYNDPFDDDQYNFLNTSSINFGVQFIPETDLQNRQQTKMFGKLRYRAGIYYYSLPYETNNEQVNDFGTTFGIGIPITIGNAISSIDFGFSYGRRGISDRNALSEGYYGLNFGVTISPDNADRWFKKRKLN